MRSFYLLLLLLIAPVILAQSSAAPPVAPMRATSDSKASEIVQAAITALGGSSVITGTQSWTIQADIDGSIVSRNVTYVLTTQAAQISVSTARGATKHIPMIRSAFVPTVVGLILSNALNDAHYSIHYEGLSVIGTNTRKVIIVSIDGSFAQKWYFDNVTALPVRIDCVLPIGIGAKESISGTILLSDYRVVSGVLYPFNVISAEGRTLPNRIAIKNITVASSARADEFNSQAGDSVD